MLSPEIEIERAINFGGFEFIEEVQKKHKYIKVLYLTLF